jgi:hypothetical protein
MKIKTIILVIVALSYIIGINCLGQNNISGTYYDKFGHEIILKEDSTFYFDWDLSCE